MIPSKANFVPSQIVISGDAIEIPGSRFQDLGYQPKCAVGFREECVCLDVTLIHAEKRTPGPAEESTQFSFVFHNSLSIFTTQKQQWKPIIAS